MYKTLIIVILMQQFGVINCQVSIPNTPCPEFFKYVYDGSKWLAEITLPTPDVNDVVLIANFTVQESNINDIGKLLLNNKNAIDDIKNNRSFVYTYTFANSTGVPQITEITYNDNVVCVGRKINNPPYTIFSLTHTLNWFSPDIKLPLRPLRKPTSRPRPQLTNDITESSLINIYQNDQNCGQVRSKRQVNSFLSGVTHFIYSGQAVPRNNHPWLAAIYHTDDGPLTFFCGGNLVSNKHVLSAAHCTSTKKNIQVKVGAHNTKDFFENGAIVRKVTKIFNHEDYRPGNGHADISILILTDAVEYTEFVKPICLWNDRDDIDTLIGDRGTIMGWGLTEKGETSSEPLQTEITIVSQQQCETVEVLKDSISNATFCAGTKGAGPCMGDSGGGLLLKREGKWYIRGIISISVGNRRLNICNANTYAVYADTVKYMNWIIDKMKM